MSRDFSGSGFPESLISPPAGMILGGIVKKALIPDVLFSPTMGEIRDTALLVDNGKIAGTVNRNQVPDEWATVEMEGVLTPGLVESHCHVGVHIIGQTGQVDCNEMVEPVTPHVRAYDGVDPRDPGFEMALAGGVTSVHILPGSANVFGGVGTLLATSGQNLHNMTIIENIGLKGAFGENPKGCYGSKGGPSTRMGVAALFRLWMTRARHYVLKREKALASDDLFEPDLRLEALAELLDGSQVLRAHCHRADDICTCIRLCQEFEIKFRLEHGTQAMDVLEPIISSGAMIAYGPALSPPKKYENSGRCLRKAAFLLDSGVPLALSTDHPVTSIDTLQVMAGMLLRYGVRREMALASITSNAARVIGAEDLIGDLREGMRADLVLWRGDPLDPRVPPARVYVGGCQVLGG
ncbi:MAG: amidohydrolase [Candidatus Wallbacteria bacterium HGW-Wallbacteria-1]|jgi:imidazolonepropionase-like amidohydrolase|uniref:Amidohydrolase n=1 Tax=Candidatus Wallbacteria bacterium HGW-Wallbacteria-1 TaxID=2013854 RepID=A0A2N1PUV2_9BACT|nr:MAG: amidohydrolase [Candidatus Wallbacteria bacterium HGW-Wallbacteria-1]